MIGERRNEDAAEHTPRPAIARRQRQRDELGLVPHLRERHNQERTPEDTHRREVSYTVANRPETARVALTAHGADARLPLRFAELQCSPSAERTTGGHVMSFVPVHLAGRRDFLKAAGAAQVRADFPAVARV